MIVVADASPLILLSQLGQLELLPVLYEQVIVPEAVFAEVVEEGLGLPGSRELADSAWVDRVKAVPEDPLVRSLRGSLGAGEAEALALASSVDADLVLMDERPGRRAARRLGLNVRGTVGVLLEAKQEGLVAEIGPYWRSSPATEHGWLPPCCA